MKDETNAINRVQNAFPLAVQRLNSFCIEEGKVGAVVQDGWKISQVEKLIGLSRRDIQRACYSGQGGAAILNPEDSSWGKRIYSYKDIAKLFVVKRYRQQGMSLVEIKELFERFDESKKDYSLLDVQVSLMLAERDELERQIACAELLTAIVKEESDESFSWLLGVNILNSIIDMICIYEGAKNEKEEVLLVFLEGCASISKEEKNLFRKQVISWIRSGVSAKDEVVQRVFTCYARKIFGDSLDEIIRNVLTDLLNQPRMEPTLELWFGPGGFDFIEQAVLEMCGEN